MLLTCTFDSLQLEGSPIVVAQNDKFDGEQLVNLPIFIIYFHHCNGNI